MRLRADSRLCCGCEECIAICPTGAIELREQRAVLRQERCLSCGACLSECPMGALYYEQPEDTATSKLY